MIGIDAESTFESGRGERRTQSPARRLETFCSCDALVAGSVGGAIAARFDDAPDGARSFRDEGAAATFLRRGGAATIEACL